MVEYMMIAAVSMAALSIAHNTGFIEKAYVVCGDIARCPMCSTCWGTFFVLICYGCRPLEAAALSFAAAFLSNWFGLLLWRLNLIYDELWKKINDLTNPPKRS